MQVSLSEMPHQKWPMKLPRYRCIPLCSILTEQKTDFVRFPIILQSYLDVYEPQVYTGIQCVVVNCSESITLRTSISSNDRELCQIPLGATVDYIDSAENGFCLVDYEGIIGYVKEDYLAF